MKLADARAVLQSTQQLRTHWSGVITTHVGYTVVINVAIWSYFMKAYIDSLAIPEQAQPLYIGLASALSSILLMLWRFYTRYLDNHIAGLYPDFLRCEHALSVPIGSGTSGYLIREVPLVGDILQDGDLSHGQKMEGVQVLIKSKRIGRRGHLWFDLCTLLVILVMSVVSGVALKQQLQNPIVIVCFLGMAIGFFFTIFEFFYYQRQPSRKLIQETLTELKN